MRLLALSLLTTAFLTPSLQAAQPDCMKTANTQQDMNACASQQLKAADQQLNATYKTLLGRVSKPGAVQLRKAQRAWVSWRDEQCRFDTLGSRDGSVNPMVYAMCLNDLTVQQNRHLASQLHCEEGDLSCGRQ